MTIAFFKRRTSCGDIRGKQIGEFMGAKINPELECDKDTCVFVKMRPWFAGKKNYIDVVDNPRYIDFLRKNHQFGGIAISKIAHEYISDKSGRNDICTIPQQHCNFKNEKRTRREVTTAGYIGEVGSLQDYQEISDKLKKNGIELLCRWHAQVMPPTPPPGFYKKREDVVDFYKSIDIQIVWRPKVDPAVEFLKNPLKLSNAGSFGIPTVAYPEKSFVSEYPNGFVPAMCVDELVDRVKALVNNKMLYKTYSQAAEEVSSNYHISEIAKLYQGLETH
jgi:hypothetical protein